jgi:hypothetical protein
LPELRRPPPEDPITDPKIFLGAKLQSKGIFVRNQNLQGPPCKSVSKIVLAVLLKLVKSIENHRKSEKCKLDFVGFLVKNPTTLVKHDHSYHS